MPRKDGIIPVKSHKLIHQALNDTVIVPAWKIRPPDTVFHQGVSCENDLVFAVNPCYGAFRMAGNLHDLKVQVTDFNMIILMNFGELERPWSVEIHILHENIHLFRPFLIRRVHKYLTTKSFHKGSHSIYMIEMTMGQEYLFRL